MMREARMMNKRRWDAAAEESSIIREALKVAVSGSWKAGAFTVITCK